MGGGGGRGGTGDGVISHVTILTKVRQRPKIITGPLFILFRFHCTVIKRSVDHSSFYACLLLAM